MIVVYKLGFIHLLKVALKKNLRLDVILIGGNSERPIILNFKIFLLRLLNIAVVKKRHYFLKDFIDRDGSSPDFGLREKADLLSLEFALLSLNEIGLSELISKDFFGNLQIYLSQCYNGSIVTTLREITLFEKSEHKNKGALHVLTDYRLIKFFERTFINENVHFYYERSIFEFLKLISYYSLYSLSLRTGFLISRVFWQNKKTRSQRSFESILTLTSEMISPVNYLRSEISWFLSEQFLDVKLFCLSKFNRDKGIRDLSVNSQHSISVFKLKYAGFRKYLIMKRSLKDFIRIANFVSIKAKSFADLNSRLFTFKEVMGFIWDIESYNILIYELNCKLFVYQDAYFRESHVFNTLADLGLIKSLKIQYSNVALRALPNISNPSIAYVFSNHYGQFYSFPDHGIGPKTYVSCGYPFSLKNQEIISRASVLRMDLSEKGAKFVIGYFDENFQSDEDIWAYKTSKQNLDDIYELCKLILEQPDVGVIYKSQFVRNTPLLLHPKDELIEKAVNTGRFVFPHTGIHRNSILPSEIALASDICIGDIVGATASLESVILGTNSILIDTMNFGPKYRRFYYEENSLVFKSLKEALNELVERRNSKNGLNDFGNWSNVCNKLGLSQHPGNEILSKQIRKQFNS